MGSLTMPMSGLRGATLTTTGWHFGSVWGSFFGKRISGVFGSMYVTLHALRVLIKSQKNFFKNPH